MKKKYIFLSITSLFLAFLLGSTVNAVAITDIQGHWAEARITQSISNGYMAGYPDGSFRPDGQITRAEFVSIANHVYGYAEQSDINFSDVSAQDWFAPEVKKAVAAGYISGYSDKSFKPHEFISRQEAASVVAAIKKLDNSGDSQVLNKFIDGNDMGEWAKGSVAAVVAQGFMNGYPDMTYRPQGGMTRAECVVLFQNMGQNVSNPSAVVEYNSPGVFGPESGTATVKGSVNIGVNGITLQNTLIKGDLLLAKGIGEGQVTLKNVQVEGTVKIEGGGAHSVTLENCQMPSLFVSKEGVRVIATGSTSVNVVQLQNGAVLVQATTSGPGFNTVTVAQTVPAGAVISLTGSFNNVNLESANASVNLAGGTVANLNVGQNANGAKIDVASDARVNTLTFNAASSVTGTGAIGTAIVNVVGVSLQQTPATLTNPNNVSVVVGGSGQGTGSGGGGGVALLNLVSSDPSDGATGVAALPTIKLTFDRGVVRDHWDTNQNCVSLKDNLGQPVASTVFRAVDYLSDAEKSNIYIQPNAALTAGATYTVVISADLMANNDNTLGIQRTVTFTVTGGGGGGGGGGGLPTAELTGTAVSTPLNRGDIITGGKTIIVTLTGGTWATQISSNQAKREALLDGLDADGSETAEWDKVIAATKLGGDGAVSRDSDTQVTITLSAAAGYGITSSQTITLNIPSGSISGVSTPVTATPSINISPMWASLSGTAITSGPAEADIVAGGKTIIVTLTGGTWAAQISSSQAKREALLDGLDAGSETGEWDKVITATKALGALAVSRDSDTQVTITLAATAGYDISANQTITLNIPGPGSISGVANIVKASPTFTISCAGVSAVLSGTAITSAPAEADIVAGGKTIIVTLTGGTWAAQISSNQAKREALLDGLDAGSETGEWDKVITATKALGAPAVSRDSDTQVTITLAATAGYDISANQTITLNIPGPGSISGAATNVTAAPTFTIGGGTVVTAALSGSAIASSPTEADIVAGSKTIVVTLTGGTWAVQISSNQAKREALLDGLDAGSETGEWDKVITATKALGAAAVSRDSDTQVTITLAATAGYDIGANQTITLTIPGPGSLSGYNSPVVAAPTVSISRVVTAALSGTAITAAPTEADISAGGKTIIVTLTGGTWGTQISSSQVKREALLDGLDAGSEAAEWDKVIAASKAVGAAAVSRDSDTQVTITLALTAGYDISANQTISLAIPSGSISSYNTAVTAAPTLTISPI